MSLQRFSIFDSKAELWFKPFYEQTVASGLRAFAQAVNTEGSPFNLNAGDYTLFHLGDFDERTGDETVLPTRANIGLAINMQTSTPTVETTASHMRGIQGGE